MSKPLSPIERMIDQATGFRPENYIKLICPNCKREQLVARNPIDPATATEVHFPCPKHHTNGKQLPEYRDAAGNKIQ
jgi:predicted RNA-binding Zn-ribbon protein involved in translation (DUF1610 family)